MTIVAAGTAPAFSISVVSHGHGEMLAALLDDVFELRGGMGDEVIVTLNIPEEVRFDRSRWPDVRWIENPAPKGFAANHNAALSHGKGEYFAVVNPDIRLERDAFSELASRLDYAALAAPRVRNPSGNVEDSARALVTPWHVVRRTVDRLRTGRARPDTGIADWYAGMFYVIDPAAWHEIGGFDERYFLYCEDTDFCLRLQLAGYTMRLVPEVDVIHDAQRASQVSRRHLQWHIVSLLRLWSSAAFWRFLRIRSKRA